MTDTIPFWEEEKAPTPKTHKERLAAIIEEYKETSASLRELQDDVAAKEERIESILRFILPEIMDEIGTTEIKLDDKTKIVINNKVNASLPKANEREAFDWLVENKFGGLIKSNLKVEFSREEIEKAHQLMGELQERELDAELKELVHPATLKSFVSERLEAGESLPECFSVFEFREAKITLPKFKK